ncbi:MAG TPA: hypothetical protein VH333_03040, partial [Pseudonocardiaceae bacterium]|jgi:hypothetical protein|nr:hypothetical protein [Pseudonocardiaceae bacterium]
VVKAQVSAAAELPGAAAAALDPAAQAAAVADGTRYDVDSLADAVAGGLPADQPWRVHVHLPVSSVPSTPSSATVDVTVDTLEALFDRRTGAQTDHVEVGRGVEPNTIDTAVAELAWTRDRLVQLGLKEI